MRHKWKKKEIKLNEYILSKNRKIKHVIKDCKICVKCGLRKGNAYTGNWYSILYYKDGKVLSRDRIPFKCLDTDMMKDMLFSEEDFNL